MSDSSNIVKLDKKRRLNGRNQAIRDAVTRAVDVMDGRAAVVPAKPTLPRRSIPISAADDFLLSSSWPGLPPTPAPASVWSMIGRAVVGSAGAGTGAFIAYTSMKANA